MKTYYNELQNFQEKNFDKFTNTFVPNLNKKVLGVKNPNIKEIVKRIKHVDFEFTNALPHEYFEEDLLHGYMLSYCDDFNELLRQIDKFLPYVNNWAVCDTMVRGNKLIKKNFDLFFQYTKSLVETNETYKVRFGLNMQMSYFLSEKYIDTIIKDILNIKNNDYYCEMMIAWLLATLMIQEENKVIDLLINSSLSNFVKRKTISKAIESFRINNETKLKLKELRKTLFSK